eukprot:988808-Amphidinium_carterae.1
MGVDCRHSSAASSVPEARGLFRAAVIESGAAAFSPLWRFGDYTDGISRGRLFLASRKCSAQLPL